MKWNEYLVRLRYPLPWLGSTIERIDFCCSDDEDDGDGDDDGDFDDGDDDDSDDDDDDDDDFDDDDDVDDSDLDDDNDHDDSDVDGEVGWWLELILVLISRLPLGVFIKL